jgi:hypothetical protein
LLWFALGAVCSDAGSRDTVLKAILKSLPAYHVNAAIIQASGQPRSLDTAGNYVIHPGDSPAQVNQTINRFLADKTANPYGGVTPQNPGPPGIVQQ